MKNKILCGVSSVAVFLFVIFAVGMVNGTPTPFSIGVVVCCLGWLIPFTIINRKINTGMVM